MNDSQDKKPFVVAENDLFDFYIGVNAGKRMLGRLIDAKKSIKIVSPFLAEDKIEELRNRRLEGLDDIFIITTVPEEISNEEHLAALRKLIHPVRADEYRVILNTAFFKENSLHEKLYIIDDEIVYSGSFNFTNAGVNNNMETAITIKDPGTVSEIVSYFDRLFKTDSIEKWDPAELAKKIYAVQSK